ncbi:MAG: TSUP family transporter [Clostridia bacterium]|nr:TSUP family transporter [Clostridia bacterium]
MRFLFLALAGVAGGVLAGLGIGGGTLTIPILVLALGVGQLTAQAVNLISFLPTGAAALFLHIKNGYVKFDGVLFFLFPALVACIAASAFAVGVNGEILKRVYGGFLVAVAIATLTAKIFEIKKIGYLH